MFVKRHKKLLSVAAALVLTGFATGCGGGTGIGGGGNGSSAALSGTAAKGAAIANGTVTVRDVKGKTLSTTTDSQGKYRAELQSSSVGTMEGPYIVKVVDGSKEYYSTASASGTVNITPLTTVILANALGKSPKSVFDLPVPGSDSSFSSAQTLESKVTKQEKNLQNSLGISSEGYNLMGGDIDAGSGKGMDGVLDKFFYTEDTANGNFTIIYGATGGSAVMIADEYDGDDGDTSKEKRYAVSLSGVSKESLDSLNQTTLQKISAQKKDLPQTNVDSNDSLTLEELNKKGLVALLSAESVTAANTYFAAAVKKIGSDSSNQADIARFAHALTRIAVLGYDIGYDGELTGPVNTAGDLLDSAGCSTTLRMDWEVVSCPDPNTVEGRSKISDSSATGSDVRTFIVDFVRREIVSALEELEKVSTSFQTNFSYKGRNYEVDYTDVLIAQAYYHGALSSLYGTMSLQWQFDIDDAVKNKKSLETIISENKTTLEKIKYQSQEFLDNSKSHYLSSLRTIDKAIDAAIAEPKSSYEEIFTIVSADVPVAKKVIPSLISAADGNTDITTMTDSFTLDLSRLFSGSLDINSLVPKAKGAYVDKSSVDWTLGGINNSKNLYQSWLRRK